MAEMELPNPKELEEQKENTFSKRVALVTAFYAVMLAITSLGGGHAGKEMILAQQEASDAWAHYQAKSQREFTAKALLRQMEGQILLQPGNKNAEAYKKIMDDMKEDQAGYNEDKKDIEQEAKSIEAKRDLNLKKDPYFEFAEVFLQIAVVLASISILSNSLPVFLFSTVTASLGAILSINGFFLFFTIPLLH